MQDKFGLIDDYIEFGREIFSELAIVNLGSSGNFSQLIENCFNIKFTNYEYILDCWYLFEDTREANKNYRKYGLNGTTKDSSTGERYLRFYGLMNSCFMQRDSIICCHKNLGMTLKDENIIRDAKIFEFRNSFAAHPLDRKGRSFVLCRIDLENDRASGYSWNSGKTNEKIFRNENITDLLNEWDEILLFRIKEIVNHLVTTMGNFKTLTCVNELFDKFYPKLEFLNKKCDNPENVYFEIDDTIIEIRGWKREPSKCLSFKLQPYYQLA